MQFKARKIWQGSATGMGHPDACLNAPSKRDNSCYLLLVRYPARPYRLFFRRAIYAGVSISNEEEIALGIPKDLFHPVDFVAINLKETWKIVVCGLRICHVQVCPTWGPLEFLSLVSWQVSLVVERSLFSRF